MEKEVLKNWLRLALIFVCVCFALVLLIAEPNTEGNMLKWFGVFVAHKAGALACGYVAYMQLEKLTTEIKN